MSSREWDAATYHRVAEPQFAWGRAVLGGVAWEGDEHVMDAGCGTGRLTAEIAERLPRGAVVGVDRSLQMVRQAREHVGSRGTPVRFVVADLAAAPFRGTFDVIFSTATFHWVLDHERLFRSMCDALRPGGRLVAQCGGGPNLARIYGRAGRLARDAPFAPRSRGPWSALHFADAETTADRLRSAGFVEVETSLVAAPTTLPDAERYRNFLRAIVLREHLAQLPDDSLRAAFLDRMVAEGGDDDPPFALDYWRLNLEARKPSLTADRPVDITS